MGQAERALAEFSRSQPADVPRLQIEAARVDTALFQLTGLGLRLLHRALLGIVLKLAVAETSSVWIPTPSLSQIRHALLHDDFSGFAGPNAIKWYEVEAIAGANPRAYAGSLSFHGYGHGDGLSIGLGGIDWVIPLSGRGNVEDEWCLATAPVLGRMQWFADDWERFLDEWDGSWPEDGQATPPDASCPCGLQRPFATCCQEGWLAR